MGSLSVVSINPAKHSGTQLHELIFWVYADGHFVEKYGDDQLNPILEVSLNESISLNFIIEKKKGFIDLKTDNPLREKLILASAPAPDIDLNLAGLLISDTNRGPVAIMLVPDQNHSLLMSDDSYFIGRILGLSLEKNSEAYAQSKYFSSSLCDVAGDLLKISEESPFHALKNLSEKIAKGISEDVLQSILNHIRKKMMANNFWSTTKSAVSL